MGNDEQKKVQTFRFSDIALQELAWLVERWGTSKTEAMTLIIDRAYWQEQERATAVDFLTAGVDGGLVVE